MNPSHVEGEDQGEFFSRRRNGGVTGMEGNRGEVFLAPEKEGKRLISSFFRFILKKRRPVCTPPRPCGGNDLCASRWFMVEKVEESCQ